MKKFAEEKNDLEDQVRRLKIQLEEESYKNKKIKENGLDFEKASKYILLILYYIFIKNFILLNNFYAIS